MSNLARPIDEVVKDERTPSRVAELLKEVPGIKRYGEEMGLKPTRNYTHYVKLDRPAATWVVSAAPELELKPRVWSFPIVGSFTYVGWFDLENARRYAQEIRAEGGWDVDVRGASAYSTLGWFRDPILSTMISDGPDALGDLVEVILHESVHATFYVNGQSYFNESLADFVSEGITPDYLRRIEPAHPGALAAYLEARKRSEERARELQGAYQRLQALYASPATDAAKREEKARILSEVKARLGGKRDINNATLIQFRTYGVGRAEYEQLFNACGRDWKRFWGRIREISSRSFAAPHEEDLGKVLLPLARAACP